MIKGTTLSNLVEKKALREIQLEVLEKINAVISHTAGPFGSYSMIMHQDRLTEYSKDGHKVLSNFRFHRPLESAVHDELLGVTEHVIKKVGDGTTSAVQLSYLIYKALCEKSEEWEENGIPPYQIISTFQKIVEDMRTTIKSHAVPLTIDDIKHICLISTNGNEMASSDIANLYKKYGLDTYIQLNTSNTESSMEKAYDGIVLSKGMSSPSFINSADNTCVIYKPHIYYFPDPVDTPEMIQLFMNIFTENIYMPYQQHNYENYVPTVIIMPSISQDVASTLMDIEKIFYAFDQANAIADKPPFCIITGVNDHVDNIGDIVTLCGCPLIKKYINPDQRLKDIEDGKAPSADTVMEFYGMADQITIDIDKTKIINPKEMFDENAEIAEDGSRPFSATYTALLNFLKNQVQIESMNKNNIAQLSSLKRRLHYLTANFVEYYVGGVAAADRDSVKDLVEDAILNCRSAAVNGVGYGAGIEGYLASKKLSSNYATRGDNLMMDICDIIKKSYTTMIINLYKSGLSEADALLMFEKSEELEKAYNLREQSFDGNQVLCSIETDISILEAISRIITIMYTTNQAFLIDPMQNAYIDVDNK